MLPICIRAVPLKSVPSMLSARHQLHSRKLHQREIQARISQALFLIPITYKMSTCGTSFRPYTAQVPLGLVCPHV